MTTILNVLGKLLSELIGKYRIVARTNTCYYSENQIFLFFKVSNTDMPKFFFRNITFLFVVRMSWNFVRIHDCPKSCANPITVTRIFSIGFFPLANGVYFVVIIKKTSLHNGNCPITDPITKMGVAHAFESCNCQYVSNETLFIHSQKQMLSFWLQLGKFQFWIIVSW